MMGLAARIFGRFKLMEFEHGLEWALWERIGVSDNVQPVAGIAAGASELKVPSKLPNCMPLYCWTLTITSATKLNGAQTQVFQG